MGDDTTTATKGAGKVSVACKLPAGLTVTHKGQTVTLVGANASGSIAGFGITTDVDADWFADWVNTDGKDLPAVANGSIFSNDGRKVNAEAKERKDTVSGLEPLDPSKPGPGLERVPDVNG